MFSFHDTQYMKRALYLAKQAAGRTSPNPLVGCVIVRDGHIVGEGYHRKAGQPHAEIHALEAAGDKAKGADVFVTLEPCSHYGRTPPCTEALIQAGVRRVVAAMADPHPQVQGQGMLRLHQSGIEVQFGLLEDQARVLNQGYLKVIESGLPFVLYKSALTMDGKHETFAQDIRWITNEQSRNYVHHLRDTHDVILVGSRTVIIDNPRLTCRLPDRNGRNPVRLIVDGKLATDPTALVFENNPQTDGAVPDLVIVATTEHIWNTLAPEDKARWESLEHVEIWPYASPIHVPLPDLMRDLVKRGWNTVLLEGGETLAKAMLQAELVDKIEFFYAPKLYGPSDPAVPGAHPIYLEDIEYSWKTGDLRISAYPKYHV